MMALLKTSQNTALMILVVLLNLMGWYLVVQQNQTLTQATITAYQQTELEIVRTLARSVENYVSIQINQMGRSSVGELEQEIFNQFVEPVRLLESGDAWIYAPDHVVFDLSSDFPDQYRGKSMAEIFALQASQGASHYEAMTQAVMQAQEGVGWYIWLPAKGQEIAAWTPVTVNNLVWTIGLSTPLPEILASTGASTHIKVSNLVMGAGSVVSIGLLAVYIFAALKRQEVEKVLYASEQRFRHVITSISDHIYMNEVSGDNYYLSPNIEQLTGYPIERFGTNWKFWTTLILAEDRDIFQQHVDRFADALDSEVEYRLKRQDGKVIWVRDSGRVDLTARSPEHITVYGVVSDITLRKDAVMKLQQYGEQLEKEVVARTAELVETNSKLEQNIVELQQIRDELATARDQALQASYLKSQILARVSHELRTPLNAIQGYVELLHNGIFGQLTAKQLDAVTNVIDSTHYLADLVNELLDQAQLEVGAVKLNQVAFDPVRVLGQVSARVSVLAEAKGLQFLMVTDPQLPDLVVGDPQRLQQVLVNLTSNAIKFTKAGQIKVSLLRAGLDRWAMQVEDTGLGIPVEAKAYIFEPFWQVDGSVTREHNGTGLGLSIVKQLVELMRGEIQLQSKVGQGTTFTVFLPTSPARAKTDQPPPRA
ncbi:MAG TPA: ATP-binding protein [Anaerolineae bacterium]|nr:ATP-binding protein [Anaerolineae bacterium]